MHIAKETVRIGLPLVFGLSVLFAVSFVNDLQALRAEANNPQKGTAEDIARTLAENPTAVIPAEAHIPIESSLSPFFVVYTPYSEPVTGTGYLHGELPHLPAGVFDAARGRGENLVTWQPEYGVRAAIIVVPVNNGTGGYVVGGRSLRYTEEQERLLVLRTAIGWAAMLIAVIAGFALASLLRRR